VYRRAAETRLRPLPASPLNSVGLDASNQKALFDSLGPPKDGYKQHVFGAKSSSTDNQDVPSLDSLGPDKDDWKDSPFMKLMNMKKKEGDLPSDGSNPLGPKKGKYDPTGWYLAQHPAIVRKGPSLKSARVTVLPVGANIWVRGYKGQRFRIESPVFGWVSMWSKDSGVQIMERDPNAPMNMKLNSHESAAVRMHERPNKYQLAAQMAWLHHQLYHVQSHASKVERALNITTQAENNGVIARQPRRKIDMSHFGKSLDKGINDTFSGLVDPFMTKDLDKQLEKTVFDGDDDFKNKAIAVAQNVLKQEQKKAGAKLDDFEDQERLRNVVE